MFTYVSLILLFCSWQVLPSDQPDTPSSEKALSKGMYLDAEATIRVNTMMTTYMILAKDLENKLIRSENRNEELRKAFQDNKNDSIAEYVPVQPTPLTKEEQREKDIVKRFSANYIGPVSEETEEVIAHIHFRDSAPAKHKVPNTILLHGQPGTGKGYLVQQLSHALQIPMLSVNAGSFVSKWAGNSTKNINSFFSALNNSKEPLIAFIDEVDTIGLKRSSNESGGGEYRAALNALLVEVQNLSCKKNVYIFLATNTLKDLDPALTNRFEGQVIEIKKLSGEEHYLRFFEKHIKDNLEELPEVPQDGPVDPEESVRRGIENKLHALDSKDKAKVFYSKLSRTNTCAPRELAKAVSLAFRHQYTQKNLHGKDIPFEESVDRAYKNLSCNEKGYLTDYF